MSPTAIKRKLDVSNVRVGFEAEFLFGDYPFTPPPEQVTDHTEPVAAVFSQSFGAIKAFFAKQARRIGTISDMDGYMRLMAPSYTFITHFILSDALERDAGGWVVEAVLDSYRQMGLGWDTDPLRQCVALLAAVTGQTEDEILAGSDSNPSKLFQMLRDAELSEDQRTDLDDIMMALEHAVTDKTDDENGDDAWLYDMWDIILAVDGSNDNHLANTIYGELSSRFHRSGITVTMPIDEFTKPTETAQVVHRIGEIAKVFNTHGIEIKSQGTGYKTAPRHPDGYTLELDGEEPELISPPMAYDHFAADITTVVDVIGDHFAVDSGRGLHIGVSFPGMNPDDIDVMKLVLFLGEQHLTSEFGRENSQFTKHIRQVVREVIFPMLGALDGDIGERIRHTIYNISDENRRFVNRSMQSSLVAKGKHYTVNAAKLMDASNPYLEFRVMGGEYVGDIAKILNTTDRYIYALQLAMDRDAELSEYVKKLTKLVSELTDDVDLLAAVQPMIGARGSVFNDALHNNGLTITKLSSIIDVGNAADGNRTTGQISNALAVIAIVVGMVEEEEDDTPSEFATRQLDQITEIVRRELRRGATNMETTKRVYDYPSRTAVGEISRRLAGKFDSDTLKNITAIATQWIRATTA